jgi:K+-transporting ATPase A subunit
VFETFLPSSQGRGKPVFEFDQLTDLLFQRFDLLRGQSRFGLAIPALVFAGLFARQKIAPRSAGTLQTDSFAFGCLLTGFLTIATALSYLPPLALGPVLEQLFFKT